MKTPGEKLKELLDKKGVSAYEVSQKTGIAESVFSKMIQHNSKPSIKTKEKLANYFGITVDYFNTKESDLDVNHALSIEKLQSEDEFVEYLIDNYKSLLLNKSFKSWIETIELKAQREILKELAKK